MRRASEAGNQVFSLAVLGMEMKSGDSVTVIADGTSHDESLVDCLFHAGVPNSPRRT